MVSVITCEALPRDNKQMYCRQMVLFFPLCSPVRQSRVINVSMIYFLPPLYSPAVPCIISSFLYHCSLHYPILPHTELRKKNVRLK